MAAPRSPPNIAREADQTESPTCSTAFTGHNYQEVGHSASKTEIAPCRVPDPSGWPGGSTGAIPSGVLVGSGVGLWRRCLHRLKADDLVHALHEFVTIERLVALNDWKRTRHAPPERRVLMGDCLLVRYVEADQAPGVAKQNRENERRRRKREEHSAAFREANPGKQFRLNKEQSAQCKWSPEGLRLRLRVVCEGVDCDLHQALLMSTLRDGDRLVLYPRWSVDERLPAAERKEFTPTPKQMLYG
jgi:hypothetical protein